MIVRNVIAQAAALAVAAGAGWIARTPATPEMASAHRPTVAGAEPVAAPTPKTPKAPMTPTAAAVHVDPPLIAVSADGQVTLRVEQQPLDWVLEQIALQTGYRDLRQHSRPVGETVAPVSVSAAATAHEADSEASCTEAPVINADDLRRALAAIERGSEAERFDGLLAAGAGGVQVPEATLKTLVETDASDRVRLAALERILEAHSGDLAAERAALEAALYVPNAAVQLEARRRLDELTEAMRPDPTDPQLAVP